MTHHRARILFCVVLAACTTGSIQAGGDRTVYLGGHLDPVELISFTCTLQAGSPESVVLLDHATGSAYTRALLQDMKVKTVVPVGLFPGGTQDVQDRLKVKTVEPLAWHGNPPAELWRSLFPRAEQVVVCSRRSRRLMLQAACLAVSLRAPLFLLEDTDASRTDLGKWLDTWQTKNIYAVGRSSAACEGLTKAKITRLATEDSIFRACADALGDRAITTLVVANPADVDEESGGMSVLAPWIAGQRRALLVLTNDDGNNVEERVHALVKHKRFAQVENIVLVAGLSAIPTKRRPNPIPDGKDPQIEMEPLTPSGNDPYSFAIGRLFGDSPAVVVQQLARQRLLLDNPGPRTALVASDPGSGLPLLQAFSRNTAQELRNAGYQTTALFGDELTCSVLRKEMPRHDIVLWEGHHGTLINDWEMPKWDEPLPGSLVVLQSCLALQEAKAQPLLRRGAVGVIGSSTRTYSASGGAISLAFFNAMLYDDQSAGAALRQAKNFLLAYSLLKEKRLGDAAKRTGANQRTAWAFSLWGDPTFTLPSPPKPDETLTPVRHEVNGNTIVVKVPDRSLDRVRTQKYRAQMPPNGRLAGLIRKDPDDEKQPLVPFLFLEVYLPNAPAGKVPHLKSKLADSHHVFCWDERRKRGYLLVEPHKLEEHEFRFHVTWEAPTPVAAIPKNKLQTTNKPQ